VNVTKGTYVSPASPIMEIIDSDHIHLELSVFEKDIMKLKKGQPILFRIPEASADTFEAEVHLIGTSIGENRTVKVHGHLKNEKGHHFLTGMFVEASIVIDTMAGMALPTDAIANLDGADYVLRKEKGKAREYSFKRIEVQTDRSYKGFTEIKNPQPFVVTDTFLIKGAFNLIRE
jgi:cobalt-zinc-cadmium efflux system membrane fusion protein